MAIEYNTIVPWGRSYEEYIRMFMLSNYDLSKKILGCGDGPASFNCILTKNGGSVISVDPIYQFSRQEIQQRINETYVNVLEQTRNNMEQFNWKEIDSIEKLGQIRLSAMSDFLNDYDEGKISGRYVYGELPDLANINMKFDIALSSHFLFLYSDNLSYDFHEKAIECMLNTSKEVRIFPLLDINANRSPYVNLIINKYKKMNFIVEELTVNYEFQRNGNKMLRIRHE